LSVIDASVPDIAPPSPRSSPQIRAVLVCDLADSTALIERLGDRAAADLIRKHDRVARGLIHDHGGREIDKTDGFLVLFERPVQAVAFALEYQRALRDLGKALGEPLRARIGIHVGEVVQWENAPAAVADGAKPIEVEGLAKPVAARLMGLAVPGQVLLSEMARTLAQRAHAELPGGERVRWLAHGRYRFKGVPLPMLVHEVGETGTSPLIAPPSGGKAVREVPWYRRPAALAVEALLLLTAVAIPLVLSLRAEPAIAFAERDWVVLGDLQNQTSRDDLGQALDAALRIGLSQSRYVNVVPDLQVDDALKRMELGRDTRVDRGVGVQLAMREGARALVLPTLTEVGNRVRLSVEVVEPSSAVTVYSDSVSGEGVDSILPSADELLGKLRERLGESLSSIEQTNAPLARITTGNLDALRAYSLAEIEFGRGQIRDGMLLIEQALLLDPGFAMARVRKGIVELQALGNRAAAAETFELAQQSRDKLSAREQLMLDGVVAMAFGGAQEAVEKWTLAAKLYPDVIATRQNLGQALHWQVRQPKEAIEHFEAAANSAHPLRGYSWLSLAVIHTELGDYAKARDAVQRGRALGVWAPDFEDVLPDLAEKNYAAVAERLDAAPGQLPPPLLLERELRRAAVLADQGDYPGAEQRIVAALGGPLGPQLSPSKRAVAELARLSLRYAQGAGEADGAALAAFVESERGRLGSGDRADDDGPLTHLAFASLLASRDGDADLARVALDAARRADDARRYFVEQRLWSTADCAVQDVAKRAPCLQALVDGREPFQTRVALRDALAAAGDEAGAARQAEWLAAHRGLAVSELEGIPLQIPNLIALRSLSR
jgi:putative peptide modification system cyclase